MSVTIQEIAAQCSVPVTTVRKVLNNSFPEIPEKIQKKVLQSAKKLGYAPDSHTFCLGMIYRDENGKGLTHPFFASLLNAFKEEAEHHGYDVIFINHEIGGNGEMSYLEHCRLRNVDGVCLACMDFSTDEVKELVESEIPCVTVDQNFKSAAAVLSDNENGIHMLIDYAISLGHRRIAFIHGHNNSVVTSTRIAQFQSAMEYHRLPVPDGYLQSGLYNDIELTRQIVLGLLRMPERPTCILLPNDYCYFGAQDAAREMDLRIPEDVSFAGYDGIDLTQTLHPQLTTISQDSEQIGRESARKLILRVESPDVSSARVSVFPVKLVKGGTIAPPADGLS